MRPSFFWLLAALIVAVVAKPVLFPHRASDPIFDYTGIPDGERDRLGALYNRLRGAEEQRLTRIHGEGKIPITASTAASEKLVADHQHRLDQVRQNRLNHLTRRLGRTIQNEAKARYTGHVQQADRYARIREENQRNLDKYQALLDDVAKRRSVPRWEPTLTAMPKVKFPLGPIAATERHFDYHGISELGVKDLKNRYRDLQNDAKKALADRYGLNIPSEARVEAEAALLKRYQEEIDSKRRDEERQIETEQLEKELRRHERRLKERTKKPVRDYREVAAIRRRMKQLKAELVERTKAVSSGATSFAGHAQDLMGRHAVSWAQGVGPALLSVGRRVGRGGALPAPLLPVR